MKIAPKPFEWLRWHWHVTPHTKALGKTAPKRLQTRDQHLTRSDTPHRGSIGSLTRSDTLWHARHFCEKNAHTCSFISLVSKSVSWKVSESVRKCQKVSESVRKWCYYGYIRISYMYWMFIGVCCHALVHASPIQALQAARSPSSLQVAKDRLLLGQCMWWSSHARQ